MSTHPLSGLLPNVDRYSYYLGITTAFVEMVAMGCKRMALSPPYTDIELTALSVPTQQIVDEYRLAILVEPHLLITPLFPTDAAAERTVIIIARDQATIAEYQALVRQRAAAVAEQRLADRAEDLAWQFGRLLSYSDAAIQQLLTNHTR